MHSLTTGILTTFITKTHKQTKTLTRLVRYDPTNAFESMQ